MPQFWKGHTPYRYLRLFVIPLLSQGRRLRNLSSTVLTKVGFGKQESIDLEAGFPPGHRPYPPTWKPYGLRPA
jgi:hypothetical protein